jgi:hypothetical protein
MSVHVYVLIDVYMKHSFSHLSFLFTSIEDLHSMIYVLVVTWMQYFPLIFLWFIYRNVSNSYEIITADTRYCTLKIWAVVLLLSESRAIINDLHMILHSFMLQIIYTTVFRVKRLSNRTLLVQLFNRLTRKTVVEILL